jgi:hypothetical protein
MPTFYIDPELGNDSTTATPLGWWSVAFTGGTGPEPVAAELATGATSGSTARLTVVAVLSGGSWVGNDAAGTMYFYGKSAAFASEQVDFAGGGHMHIAADFTYCAWKTTKSGALAARIAPGDTMRIAKSPAPASIGDATWEKTAEAQGVYTVKSISSSTNASPIEITTSTNHGLVDDDKVQIYDHAVNISANGNWVVTRVSDTKFTLNGSVGVGTGAGTGNARKMNARVVVLDDAQTAAICQCETVWSAKASNDLSAIAVGQMADTPGVKEGGGCAKFTFDASPKQSQAQAYWALPGALNLSGYQKITFWYRGSGDIGTNNLEIVLCSDGAGATPVDVCVLPGSVLYKDYWTPITIARTGGGNLGSNINSILLRTGSAASVVANLASKIVYLDNIQACTTNGLNLLSLFSKNTLEQMTRAATNYGNECWHAIQSITGPDNTWLVIDNNVNCKASLGRPYYSENGDAIETVATYKRETTKPGYGTGSANSFDGTSESGTISAYYYYRGGYDPATNEQTGDTILDGQNGNYIGMSVDHNYNYFERLSLIRFYYGMNCANSYRYHSFGVIPQLSNNTNYGFGSYLTFSFGGQFLNCCYNGAAGFTVTSASAVELEFMRANNNIDSGFGSSLLFMTVNNLEVCNNGSGGFGFSSFNTLIKRLVARRNTSYPITTGQSGGMIIEGDISDYLAPGTNTSDLHDGRIRINKYVSTGFPYVIAPHGNIQGQASVRHTASGMAWVVNITNTARGVDYPLYFTVARVACVADEEVTVTAWMKLTNTTDILGALRVRPYQARGVDVEEKTNMATADTDWHEVTVTFTPTEACVIEVEVMAWWVANTADESVYVDDITVSQAA